MSVSIQDIKSCLKEYEFSYLFRDLLGWNQKPEAIQHITYQEQSYDFHLVSDKSGFKVYLHTCPSHIYPMAVLKQLDTRLTDVAAAHLTIFVDAQHRNQLWLWIKRQGGRATSYPTYMNELQSGELLAQKVHSLYINIEYELQNGIHLVDVIERVIQGFDVERVTRAFYDGSKSQKALKISTKNSSTRSRTFPIKLISSGTPLSCLTA